MDSAVVASSDVLASILYKKRRRLCSDPNNESDPSSEYSLLGLTHVMNHCLGQKFIIWVKINCLDMSPNPGTGIPRPRTVHGSLYILLEMQHTQMAFQSLIKLQGRRAIGKSS